MLKIKIYKINPSILLTKNRYDIIIRRDFLTDVIDNNKPPNETLYYNFISDEERDATRDPDISSMNYIELYKNIKLNGVINPILIGEYPSGFQLIDGAHRLAITLYLNFDKIPVKVIPTTDFIMPDYSEAIKEKYK